MDQEIKIDGKRLNLFSTPIWVFKADQLSDANMSFKTMIDNGTLGKPSVNARSNRNGARYEFDLMKVAPKKLVTFLLRSIKHVISSDFLISIESWVNLHEQGGYNSSHMHPGYLLSGVYYISVGNGSGALVLEDPRPQTRYAANHVFITSVDPAQGHRINAEEGMLVLFPSWLMHHVTDNTSKERRISISMNISAHLKPK